MKKRQVIALLTDFSLDDVYVASMKGVILSLAPDVQIIDITHSAKPRSIDQAAYLLWSCFNYFPQNTIFVCVVDPEVGTSRKIICAESDGYKFLAPDNGILKFVLGSIKKIKSVFVVDQKYFLPKISNTFHGRDIFAPVAAHLANGVPIRILGPKTTPLHAEYFIEVPTKLEIEVQGKIIHIDHFGNIVTNYLCKNNVPDKLRLRIGKRVIKGVSETYADAKTNKPFIILGSSSLLEVSIKNGNAAKIVGSKINDPIKLIFEK